MMHRPYYSAILGTMLTRRFVRCDPAKEQKSTTYFSFVLNSYIPFIGSVSIKVPGRMSIYGT